MIAQAIASALLLSLIVAVLFYGGLALYDYFSYRPYRRGW